MFNKYELLKISNTLWDKSRDEYALIFPNEDEYKDIMDYRQLHSKVVADLALEMFDCYYENLYGTAPTYYKTSFYLACLIHDVKKLDKKHNKTGAKYLFNNQDLLSDSSYNIELIFSIINYHSADKKGLDLEYINEIRNLHDDIKLLILFTRLSDKLSKPVIKSSYKTISTEEVDEILNKIKKNSRELLDFNNKLTSLLNEIETNFKSKYCS